MKRKTSRNEDRPHADELVAPVPQTGQRALCKVARFPSLR
jgi:hypothetical protein